MRPGKLDLEIYRGDWFEHPLEFFADDPPTIPLALDAFTYRAQIRRLGRGTPVLAELEVDVTEAAEGRLVLTLDDDQTAELPGDPLKWDLQETLDGAKPTTVLAGIVTVEGDSTREGS